MPENCGKPFLITLEEEKGIVSVEGLKWSSLFLAVRKLQMALERPLASSPEGFDVADLPDAEADEIDIVFRLALQSPDKLPLGVEMKLRDLCPVYQLRFCHPQIRDPNHRGERILDALREIEDALVSPQYLQLDDEDGLELPEGD